MPRIPLEMWNPFALPLAVVAMVADLPRALANLARATDLMEEGVERLERLNEQGDTMLAEMHHARELVERLVSGGDDLVAASEPILESLNRAQATAERLLESTGPMLEAMQQAQPSAERLAEYADPILQASIAARDQLRETQAELAAANERVARVLDLAAPIESVAGRLTGRRGRDAEPS